MHQVTNALQSFESRSILLLGPNGFTHFCALANERAALSMSRKQQQQDSDGYWTQHYLTQPASLYEEWGGSAKVQQLVVKYAHLFGDVEICSSATAAIRGRSRIEEPCNNRNASLSLYHSVSAALYGSGNEPTIG